MSNKVIGDSSIKMALWHSDMLYFQKNPYSREALSIFDAARIGAKGCIKVVGYVVSNIMAFTAIIQFLNATLGWFGARVGVEGLTFQVKGLIKLGIC